MLLMFHGLPIHIIRDVFVTSRDFLKRLNALLRYRRAIQEMNQYPDATEEELARENTCIICREEMRPWDAAGNPATVDRVRPKKLPCGHTLHLGCLKSWLERQQVCPTCRRPVATERPNNGGNRRAGLRIQIGGGAPAAVAPGANVADARGPNPQNQAQDGQEQPPPQGQQPQQQQQPEQRPRVFNLGPLRLGFAANGQQVRELARQFGMPNQGADNNQNNNDAAATPTAATSAAAATPQGVHTGDNLTNAASHLQQAEQAFQRELQGLQNRQQEIHTSQLLLAELQRLRQRQPQADPATADAPLWTSGPTQVPANLSTLLQPPPFPHMPGMSGFPSLPARISSPLLGRHGASGYTTSIPSGSLDLPEGVVIPPGWSLMPLQRLDGANLPTNSVGHPGSVPANGDAASSDGAGNSIDGPSSRTNRPGDLPNNISNILRPTTPLRPEDRPELGPGVLHYPLIPRAPHVRPAEPPAVVSPSPMAPNWGDSAQLFRNNARLDQQEVATQGEIQRQDHSPARSDSSNIALNTSHGAEVLGRLEGTSVPAPAPSAPAPTERVREDQEDEDEDEEEDEEEEDGNEHSDRERNTPKARAVTVADASSDEDED
jgi:E3 ubiquitin-protein ligase synoviolin